MVYVVYYGIYNLINVIVKTVENNQTKNKMMFFIIQKVESIYIKKTYGVSIASLHVLLIDKIHL